MKSMYHAAVYLRLSREDGDVVSGGKSVSNSISNQKELVMDYLKSHSEIQIAGIYTDDGYTGSNFDRPEFQKMLNDIRSGRVDCIVVKDLSRFGRNYIESGRYIEKIFPMLGVRFIAITDNYDSLNNAGGTDLIVPFKNLINDAYCRDISVKIRSHMDVKRKNGEYIGAFAAYGYLKDPENKNHLVVDPYAADVVRDIFTMKICGMSQQAIADRLNADGILSPIQYKKSTGQKLTTGFQKAVKPTWSYNAVRRILKNEVYIGTTVQGKSTTPNYKVKKRVHIAEEDWVKVEKTHDPIVSEGEFALVQELLQRDMRVAPEKETLYPLAGLVYCADCGEPMVRKTIPSGGKRYVYYVCSGNKRDRNHCSAHSISEEKLSETVLKEIQFHIAKVLTAAQAIEVIQAAPAFRPDVQKQDQRIEKLQEEADTARRRGKNLYEDYKDGILSRDEYIMLKNQYEKEVSGIEENIQSLQEEKDNILQGQTVVQEWIGKFKEYQNVTELDRRVVTFLIDRIEITAGGGVVIHYSFGREIAQMEKMIESCPDCRKEAV